MRSNLRTRVITALVLAAIVIGTLVTGSTPLWALVVTAFCAAAGWEFMRLSPQASGPQKLVSCVLLIALIAGFVYSLNLFADSVSVASAVVTNGKRELSGLFFQSFLALASLFWLVAVPRQLSRRFIGLASWPSVVIMPVVIGAAWLSAVLLQREGARFLVAVIVVTVVADVAGYFVGRSFGRIKLAPSISPGKTREGAIGGVTAAALWSALMTFYLGLMSGLLPVLAAAFVGAFLGACAVVGDLWESQLKRQANVKDSSQLLPGHGGVLDRIDAQLAVLPLATLLISLLRPLW